jgi:hypothetical protein
MSKYFKDSFEWDLGKYLSQIHLIYSNVTETIKRFSECLDNNRDKEQEMEIEEEFGSTEIDQKLFESLISLSENLKNAIYFNPLLVLAYSFFEFGVMEYCQLLDNYKKEGKKFEKYKGRGINRAKTYLINAFDINLESDSNWNRINDYRVLRNLIIHQRSNIIRKPNKPIEDQPNYKIISSMADIDITSSGYIFIKKIDHINNLLDISVTLLNNIIDQTKSKIDE